MFQMTEDGINWTEVSEERTREVLSRVYQDVDLVIEDLRNGATHRSAVGTFYRWEEDIPAEAENIYT